MSDLTKALCSITATQRRRFFWAVWSTGAPCETPFRKPDASGGGARSEDEARAAAERAVGRHVVLTEPYWARAWNRVLRGERPPPRRAPRARAPGQKPPALRSAWTTLRLAPGASLAEVRKAFRQLALETHPDHGGNADDFRAVQDAYERLVDRLARRVRSR
ncbi:MAG: J domain-containing protein [Deltaproteobacteria bacterium]|nr:J domain-containing protein [Deltaproteobacteria bacterium]